MQQLQFLANSVFLQPEFSTTAVPIALGASGTLVLGSGATANIATLTFTAAHGYTAVKQFNGITTISNATTGHGPTNYGGSTLQSPWTYFQLTGATGVTAVNGVTFVILSIVNTTVMTVYIPLAGTSPTVTAASFLPVWVPSYGDYNMVLGANCAVQYNPDNTGAPVLPGTSVYTPTLPTPTFRTLQAVSTTGQLEFDGAGQQIIIANGSAGTSRWSIFDR
jgi:hypothetical protein